MQGAGGISITILLLFTTLNCAMVNAAVQISPNLDKDAELSVVHYEKDYDFTAVGNVTGIIEHRTQKMRWDLGKPGYWTADECVSTTLGDEYNWQLVVWNGPPTATFIAGGGTVCSGRENPSTPEQTSLPEMPSIFCKGGAVRLEAPPWSQSWDETLGRTQLSTYQLRTGSKAVPKRKSFFRIVGGATGYNNLFYPDVDLGTGTYPIDPTIIKIGDLGSLSADRYLYKALPDGETHDATPKVPRRYYTHTVGFNKYRFISECHAPIPANRARTTIGVGEEVDLNFQPGLPAGIAAAWSTTAGTLSYANGPLNRLTAPERKNTATVKATIRGETCSIDFSVEEPTGINATVRGAADYFPVHPAVGAGMHMDVVLQPNAVSFYRVQVKEPGETTAGKEGYFTVHEPPSHSGNGADKWHEVYFDNKITDEDFDHASSYGWPIGESGKYTWPIHPIWCVVGSSSTKALSGWTDQKHTLSEDGTMKVEKLGHIVERGPYQDYGTVQ